MAKKAVKKVEATVDQEPIFTPEQRKVPFGNPDKNPAEIERRRVDFEQSLTALLSEVRVVIRRSKINGEGDWLARLGVHADKVERSWAKL